MKFKRPLIVSFVIGLMAGSGAIFGLQAAAVPPTYVVVEANEITDLQAFKDGYVNMGPAAVAEAKSIRISTHLWTEVSAQLLCTTPMLHWLEYCDWWNPILAEPLRVEGGLAMPSESAGSGVSWNEQAIGQCLA